jgi:hypothetical protein
MNVHVKFPPQDPLILSAAAIALTGKIDSSILRVIMIAIILFFIIIPHFAIYGNLIITRHSVNAT